jgi:hypothetical protein
MFFGDGTNLRSWGAAAGVLIAALTLAGCPTRDAATDVDGEAEVARDASAAKPDAGTGAGGAVAMSSGGSTGSGGSRASNGGAPPADAGTKPPPPNQACTVAAQCPSGFCVDGVCCDTACDGACESCAQTGKVGTCSPVKNGADDACMGDSICDATGACRKGLGKSCSASSQCASGNCVDGVCCATAACGTCQACSVAGFEGACTPVARFVDDGECSGTNSCNGLGECRGKNGSACASAANCVSLNCVDGVCCDQTCEGTCFSCNQAQSPGTCRPINGAEDMSASTACNGTNICSTVGGGQPACKLKNGQTCSTHAQCASGNCQTIVVPPDPGNPYDPGYTFNRCE